jgi:hypothetical protein
VDAARLLAAPCFLLICRQLGLAPVGGAFTDRGPSNRARRFAVSGLNCTGSEPRLLSCPHDTIVNASRCGRKGTYVTCSPEPAAAAGVPRALEQGADARRARVGAAAGAAVGGGALLLCAVALQAVRRGPAKRRRLEREQREEQRRRAVEQRLGTAGAAALPVRPARDEVSGLGLGRWAGWLARGHAPSGQHPAQTTPRRRRRLRGRAAPSAQTQQTFGLRAALGKACQVFPACSPHHQNGPCPSARPQSKDPGRSARAAPAKSFLSGTKSFLSGRSASARAPPEIEPADAAGPSGSGAVWLDQQQSPRAADAAAVRQAERRRQQQDMFMEEGTFEDAWRNAQRGGSMGGHGGESTANGRAAAAAAAAAAAPAPAPAPAAAPIYRDCAMCGTAPPPEEDAGATWVPLAGCGHVLCPDCAVRWVRARLAPATRAGAFPFACPAEPGCGGRLSFAMLSALGPGSSKGFARERPLGFGDVRAYAAACESAGDTSWQAEAEGKLAAAGARPCAWCGASTVHYRGHGVHHIAPGRGCAVCGGHWCFACGARSKVRGRWARTCPCPAHCTAECGCGPCPRCKPGRPCPECLDPLPTAPPEARCQACALPE